MADGPCACGTRGRRDSEWSDCRAASFVVSRDVRLPPGFEAFAAGHPSPNAESLAAGVRALDLARESRGDGWLVVLLSGGASALLVAPVAGITLEDKVATGRALMRAGVAIDGLNCVRKHLSRDQGRAACTRRVEDRHAGDLGRPWSDSG